MLGGGFKRKKKESLGMMSLAVTWQVEWNTVSNPLMQLAQTPCDQQDL